MLFCEPVNYGGNSNSPVRLFAVRHYYELCTIDVDAFVCVLLLSCRSSTAAEMRQFLQHDVIAVTRRFANIHIRCQNDSRLSFYLR